MALIKFIESNLEKEDIPNKSGRYILYNTFRTPIYTGTSKKLRHRLQSYRQKDDFKTHPTKSFLRNKIHTYSYKVMPKQQAQKREKRQKRQAKFNFK